MIRKSSGLSILGRVFGSFSRVGLSANDSSMAFAYETLGDLLAKRFEEHSGPALAAASAGIIDPEARNIFGHLSRNAEQAQIVAAARLLQPALHHVTAEYLKPEQSGGQWRLKMDAAVVVNEKKSQASLIRKLDWSDLPDVVRESYMREERDTYVLTLIPLPDDGSHS